MLAVVCAAFYLAALLAPLGPGPAAGPSLPRISAQETAPEAVVRAAVSLAAPDPASGSGAGAGPDVAVAPPAPAVPDPAFLPRRAALPPAALADARARPARPASRGPPPSA